MLDYQTEKVSLTVADGGSMQAFVTRPTERGTRPGIIVFQEAFGVNAHLRNVAGRFADLGFTAIAPELFHRSAPVGFEAAYTDYDAVRPHMSALNPDGIQADVAAAFQWLRQQEDVDAARIACVGFCMGGRVSYIANATAPLRAAVSFYGGGIAPELLPLAKLQHGPILLFWGGLDKHIGPDQYRAVEDALKDAGKAYEQVVFSTADHAFFNDARPAYNEAAARQAWALLVEFFRVNGVLT
jgi:carboxymethylenebutenolidase